MILLAFFPLLGPLIPNGPFSYPGQSPLREEIIVDPQNSPVLDTTYQAFIQKLPSSEEALLQQLITYTREEIFDLRFCHKEIVEELIYNQPLLPLDFFLEHKTGVCRHIALTTTLILHRLVQDNYLKGQVFFIREDLAHSRHAWTLFVTKESIWHLDAYWNVIENAQDPKGLERLIILYGSQPIFNALQQSQLLLEKDCGQDLH